MQYAITLPSGDADTQRFERLLQFDDASAVCDLAPQAGTLRVSTCLSLHDLRSLATAVGLPVAADAIRPLPSDCCGGCGG